MKPPDFTWDAKARQYRRAGKFVKVRDLQRAVDAYLQGVQDNAADVLFEQLREGRLSVKDAQLLGEKMIARAHLNAAVAAKGGRAQMAPSDYGRAGAKVKNELQFWRDRMKSIAAGQPLDGRVNQSFRAYVFAAATTFQAFEELENEARGFNLVKSILNDGARHCEATATRPSCREVEARGFVPIKQRVPRDGRACRTNCRCYDVYKNSQTGEIRS